MKRPANIGKRQQAMTLVEVVLSLGIFSFAIISLIGLLGVGLNSNASADKDSAQAYILAFMQSEVRARVFSANGWTPGTNTASMILTNPAAYETNYFDAQGSWVANEAPTGSNAARSVYQVSYINATPNLTNTNYIQYEIQILWPYPSCVKSRLVPATVFNYE